jgi:hypothetical protein
LATGVVLSLEQGLAKVAGTGKRIAGKKSPSSGMDGQSKGIKGSYRVKTVALQGVAIATGITAIIYR